MAAVTIKMFDNEDGKTFQLDVDYAEGFDQESHAHKFATILLRAADQLAANLGMPEDAATLEEFAAADMSVAVERQAKASAV